MSAMSAMSAEDWVAVIMLPLCGVGLGGTMLWLGLVGPWRKRRRLRRALVERDRQWRQDMLELREQYRQYPSEWPLPPVPLEAPGRPLEGPPRHVDHEP